MECNNVHAGPWVTKVTCLTTDRCLTADPGVAIKPASTQSQVLHSTTELLFTENTRSAVAQWKSAVAQWRSAVAQWKSTVMFVMKNSIRVLTGKLE